MTRREFVEDVTTFSELLALCEEVGCDACYDIVDEDQRDDIIIEELRDMIGYNSWEDIMDGLARIDTGYDYYRHEGGLDFCGLGDGDIETLKMDVLVWCDEEECWEPDEEEFEEEASSRWLDDGSEPLNCEEDFSVSKLMDMCAGVSG